MRFLRIWIEKFKIWLTDGRREPWANQHLLGPDEVVDIVVQYEEDRHAIEIHMSEKYVTLYSRRTGLIYLMKDGEEPPSVEQI